LLHIDEIALAKVEGLADLRFRDPVETVEINDAEGRETFGGLRRGCEKED
jgi:hypothetical protein